MIVDAYPFFATLNAWFRQACRCGNDAASVYPFRAAGPAKCRRIVESIDDGDCYACNVMHDVSLSALVKIVKKADQVFVCWGATAWALLRVGYVVKEIKTGVLPAPDFQCWGTTTSGAPKHPLARGQLRILPDQRPILWRTKRTFAPRPRGPRS